MGRSRFGGKTGGLEFLLFADSFAALVEFGGAGVGLHLHLFLEFGGDALVGGGTAEGELHGLAGVENFDALLRNVDADELEVAFALADGEADGAGGAAFGPEVETGPAPVGERGDAGEGDGWRRLISGLGGGVGGV